MRKRSMEELQRKSADDFRLSEKIPVIAVMDNVRSMHNVGSVFRTADAFLLQGIYLCGYTPRPPHRDINKTALGATETVAWEYFASTIDAVHVLKERQFAVFAAEQAEGSEMLHLTQAGRYDRVAIIFGNEVEGVDNEVLRACDGCLEIPQAGTKHSLNISVAAGIVLWEIVKSKMAQPSIQSK